MHQQTTTTSKPPEQEDKLGDKDMTTRKYNAIRKNSTLGPATFDAIFAKLKKYYPNLLDLPAKTIVDIMYMCYSQKEYGYNQALSENL